MENRRTDCLRNDPHAKSNQSETMLENKGLLGKLDHGCVLFVQHPSKNGRTCAFCAVPLLRVQGPSVIVMLRRRGASRGRPVLGGSLKSLAFMRECPKARSG